MKLNDYCNPFSQAQQESRHHFSDLSGLSQLGIVAVTALAALVSAPFLGVGGVAAFRALTEYSYSHKKDLEKEPDSTWQKVVKQNPMNFNDETIPISTQKQEESFIFKEETQKLLEKKKETLKTDGPTLVRDFDSDKSLDSLQTKNMSQVPTSEDEEFDISLLAKEKDKFEKKEISLEQSIKSLNFKKSLDSKIVEGIKLRITESKDAEELTSVIPHLLGDSQTEKDLLKNVLEKIGDLVIFKEVTLPLQGATLGRFLQRIDFGDVSTKEKAAAAYKLAKPFLKQLELAALQKNWCKFSIEEEKKFDKNVAFLKVYPFYKQFIEQKSLKEIIESYEKEFRCNSVTMHGDIKASGLGDSFAFAVKNY